MGMDISGINPVIRSKAPERPENLWDLSDEERDAYFEAKDQWQDENPGNYFRANVWSWRPIMEAMWESGACYELDEKEFDRMSYNDGAGAKDAATCVRMANKLRNWMQEKIWDENGCWEPDTFKNDDMLVCSETNRFVTKAEAELKGLEVRSPYIVNKAHLEQFCRFLDECGGFEVW